MSRLRILSAGERRSAAQRRERRRLAPSPADTARPSVRHEDGQDPAMSPTAEVEGASLAVITCHWNFAGYRTPARNLLRFLREMDEAGIPVFGIEMHLPGAEPMMAANPRWKIVELVEAQLLWQKEAALNRLALEVPPHIPCIAQVDADVRFADPAWASRTVEALESTPAVQPYSEACWVDEWGRVDLRRSCTARDGFDERWRAHPGFAWAFRRDFFEAGPGFYPWGLSGSGDTVSATGLLGIDPPETALTTMGQKNSGPSGAGTRWIEAARAYMAGRAPGWAEGRLWHEWHGSRADRRYHERHAYMRDVEIGRHLELGGDGLLCWTRHATKAMRRRIRDYFVSRKEDG